MRVRSLTAKQCGAQHNHCRVALQCVPRFGVLQCPQECGAQQQKQNETFADADLARELGDLTRSANRANTTFYTIDPRGLVGGSDIDEQVDPTQWSDYLRKSQDSLRVIAEETGGIAVVNQNDFDKALKRIDAETSDYYVLGYTSKNSDPSRRRRQIEVKVTRKDMTVFYRKEYVLKPTPPPVGSTTTKK